MPEGRPLPDAVWRGRHRIILAVLWLHALVIPVLVLRAGYGLAHSAAEGVAVAAAAALASWPVPSQRLRATAASLGLLVASSILVHVSGGNIEMHFHFFVMVAVITLYQDWVPFLLAIGYVLLHHGVVGTLDPASVYNHPDALARPWKWAAIHGVFILAASAAGIANWRLSEAARARTELVLRSVGEGIYGVDTEGTLILVNPAALRMLAYEARALLGRPQHDVLLHGDAAGVRCPGDACPLTTPLRGGKAHQGEATFWRSDGTSFPVEYVSTPMWDRSRLSGVVVTFNDITARHWAEEERRHSMALLQHTDAERRRLVSRLVAAQEDERQRIAADIHDDSVQVMTAVGMRLQVLRRRLADPGQQQVLDQLERTVSQTIGRLRHLMFELRPPVLDRQGLAAALRMYVDETQTDGGPVYNLVDDLRDEPPTETRVILYRIAQEALTNVRKHARAGQVEIALEQRDGGFWVRIRDDGRGFAAEHTDDSVPGHLGVASMRERSELAGGGFEIRSAPGAGTTVEYWIPAKQTEAIPPATGTDAADGEQYATARTGGPHGST